MLASTRSSFSLSTGRNRYSCPTWCKGSQSLLTMLSTATLFVLIMASVGVKSENSSPLTRLLWEGEWRASESVQADAVTALVSRLIPASSHLFTISVNKSIAVNSYDTVQVVSPLANGSAGVSVTGSGGVAAAWGVLHYLKQYCNCHISWDADQLTLPEQLPAANYAVTAKDRVRYYQNVCTVSYSSVWWQWPRWEREIDWMALNGINLPLAFTGQEAIWRKVYLNLGMTEEELQEFFSGPAFLAWHRMGNLMAWGGPLPVSWHNATELLQKKILNRMRELGITPVLPCFAGHVPGAILRLFPDANVTRMSRWQGFNDTYSRTYLLEPSDHRYTLIGSLFIKEMRDAYNFTDGFYNCDPFNEQTPSSNSTEYIGSVSASIFNALTQEDPKAIWIVQGWMLLSSFWTQDVAKAFFTAVPEGRALVLDLAAGRTPLYSRFESFFGQPFVFCMLHNFGGVDGLYGYVDLLRKNLVAARSSNNTMVGTGLTMEGINQNYVMYELMMELAWADPPEDLQDWAAQYSSRRYGSDALQKAWKTLMLHVYNESSGGFYHGQHALFKRPSLESKLEIWYPLDELVSVWDDMLGVVNASGAFLKDGPKTPRTEVTNPSEDTAGSSKQEILNALILAKHEEERMRKRDISATHLKQFSRKMALVKHRKDRSFNIGIDDDIDSSENVIIDNEKFEYHRNVYLKKKGVVAVHTHTQNLPLSKDVRDNISNRVFDTSRPLNTLLENGSLTTQQTFHHDLTDVTREVLQDLGAVVVELMIDAYNSGSFPDVMSTGTYLIGILEDLDDMLGASPAFLLGSWLESADLWATNDEEKALYRYNALNQVTLWGPYPAGNLDYAIKQWQGLVRYYYLPRWQVFVSYLLDSLTQGTPFIPSELNERLLTEVEEPFTYDKDRVYSTEPVGDTLVTAQLLYAKYRPAFGAAAADQPRLVRDQFRRG